MRTGADHFKEEPARGSSPSAIPDYTTYPREFITYKWYRPLLVFLLLAIFFFISGMLIIFIASFATGDINHILDLATGGYDTLDAYTPVGVIVTLGSVAVMIPCLALANKIAGKRPFSSYTSSRGGWDFGIFFRCFLIALVVVSLPIVVVQVFLSDRDSAVLFTAAGFIMLTIIGPLQCIAEEYAFRGFIMQSFGSWFRVPVIAMVLSSAVFGALHAYNLIGIFGIFLSGMFYCIETWLAGGIEASSAIHIANNMTAFYTLGLGYGTLSSETNWQSVVFLGVFEALYALAIYVCKKKGMFERIKKDDAAIWNEKYSARLSEQEIEYDVVEFK